MDLLRMKTGMFSGETGPQILYRIIEYAVVNVRMQTSFVFTCGSNSRLG
jgi:hypothetical protein